MLFAVSTNIRVEIGSVVVSQMSMGMLLVLHAPRSASTWNYTYIRFTRERMQITRETTEYFKEK